MLVCPVWNCHKALAREPKRLVCPDGHSFDVARSGYLNLLQPQERRSREPGDSLAAVEARQRLHDRGVSAPLLDAIAGVIASSGGASASDVVLDAGCGDGFYLGSLARRIGFDAHGVDISAPAIRAAARRFPPAEGRFEWVVANADRHIPYADASFSLVLSITARMNPVEFRRVLRPAVGKDGRLLVAIASPEDLAELRGPGRDRVPRTLETFATEFTLVDQRRATTVADLDAEAVRDVLVSIYRPMRAQPIVAAMRLTFSLDLLLFKPRT
jgi:23S rRNA (guanine745-N1)-methyltransferase